MSSDILEYDENNQYLLGTILTEDFGFYDIDEIQKMNDRKFEDLNYPDFIINLDKVSFIDSSAISFLIAIKKTLDSKERKFSIVCNNPNLLMIISMTNMDKFIDIFKSLDLAIEYIAA